MGISEKSFFFYSFVGDNAHQNQLKGKHSVYLVIT